MAINSRSMKNSPKHLDRTDDLDTPCIIHPCIQTHLLNHILCQKNRNLLSKASGNHNKKDKAEGKRKSQRYSFNKSSEKPAANNSNRHLLFSSHNSHLPSKNHCTTMYKLSDQEIVGKIQLETFLARANLNHRTAHRWHYPLFRGTALFSWGIAAFISDWNQNHWHSDSQ